MTYRHDEFSGAAIRDARLPTMPFISFPPDTFRMDPIEAGADDPLDGLETARGLQRDADGTLRCCLPAGDALYRAYHDEEWGLPVDDDDRLYEKVCLEGFQAGLSWRTILHKRAAFRDAFADFAIDAVADYDARDVERLMRDEGIVRNRRKIEATIHNARRARALRDETGSLAAFFWRHEPGEDERPEHVTLDWLKAHPVTPSSTRLAEALRARDWRFVGPTTAYALMQALGLVNDHVEGCAYRLRIEAARAGFRRPMAQG